MLKGDGHEKLKDPYITCLFGSSPAHFYDSIPQCNIEGGYIGRNLVIYEEKRAQDMDLLDSDNGDGTDKFMSCIVPKYVPHLVNIASNKVVLKIEESGRILFNSWRRDWRKNQARFNDKTGFINRIPDHAIKIAMCLCLARYNNNGVIIESDITEAIKQTLTLTYANEKAASGGQGLDPLAAATRRVMDYLLTASENQLTRKDLLVRGFGDYDSQSLDKIIDTLMEMKWVKRERIGFGKETDYIYHLAGLPLNNLLDFRNQRRG